ncbi:hypothetical protein CSIV_09470 [Microbacterium sp. CSI-V]|uniref:hypothetical protein n=1 Tax=Microbacterium sp. CSI-V TaxID=1933777 RepID=UPI00097C9B10|nr:hypothetical protein [Microbacterium sp. CSI-V]ONI64924.1 hypothetical protein CSIV_09470 [Microbacterium sp. CSI-V]
MEIASELDKFRNSININLAVGALADEELPVVNNDGHHPVVAALSNELLAVLLGRIEKVGGYANVFVSSENRVTMLAFIDSSCAIGAAEAEDLASDGERPGVDATVETFLDYLMMKPNGVRLPARLDDERPFIPAPKDIQFASV